MANSSVMKVVCFVLACMVWAAPYAVDALTCGEVVSQLTPCISYLLNGGKVSWDCCNSLRVLNSTARTTPDRQTTCLCLKSAYKANPGIKAAYAAALPSKCGVQLPYNISPSTDCSKVR